MFFNIYLIYGPIVRLNKQQGGYMKKEKLYLEDIFDIDWNQVKIKFNQTEPKENKNPLELWCMNPETVNTEWLF